MNDLIAFLLVRVYSYLSTQAEGIIFLLRIGVELYTARQDSVVRANPSRTQLFFHDLRLNQATLVSALIQLIIVYLS